MADLESYLSTAHGICISNNVIAHLLWMDDAFYFLTLSMGCNSTFGEKQFCSNNHLMANEIKTKVMVFGYPQNNQNSMRHVSRSLQIKYLSIHDMISSTRRLNTIHWNKPRQFLCDQEKKAIFNMTSKIRTIGNLPRYIMFNLFDVFIRPILVYMAVMFGDFGIWDPMSLCSILDVYCMQKVTINNIITAGECGRFPANTYRHRLASRHLNRLHSMDDNKLTNQFIVILLTSTSNALLPGQQMLWSWWIASDWILVVKRFFL